MRRLITVLASGLLLLAGFTAAAVASGGSPLDLIASPATTAHGAGSRPSVEPKRPVKRRTPRPRGAEEGRGRDEEGPEAAERKRGAPSEHAVVICHHTGSWKHPFHAISVDEHSVTAHTRHGDTLGNCPTVPSSEPRTTTRGKPPWAHGPKKERAGERRPEHTRGPGNSSHANRHDRGGSSAHENQGKGH